MKAKIELYLDWEPGNYEKDSYNDVIIEDLPDIKTFIEGILLHEFFNAPIQLKYVSATEIV